MYMTEKISVVMPAYNAEMYIARSIESVLAQTYKNIELIVVDDGSQDATGQNVLMYQKNDKIVKYIFQENQGVSAARNQGIKIATGEYVSFLDADDLWLPDALKEMYGRLREIDTADYVYGRTEEIFMDGNKCLLGGHCH